jgi:MFS family permease
MLFLCGFGASFGSPLNSIFVRRVSREYRGRAMGVAISGITAGQGLGFLFAGAVSSAVGSAAVAVGICGVVGTVASLATGLPWRRAALAAARRDGSSPEVR